MNNRNSCLIFLLNVKISYFVIFIKTKKLQINDRTDLKQTAPVGIIIVIHFIYGGLS